MNGNILRGKFREKNMTQADVAAKIGISLSRFNAKLNEAGGAEFTLGEVLALKRLFDISAEQMDEIFFV